jgi:hypothetical protein
MTGSGQVVVSIGAGLVHDASGNANTASVSTDTGVTYDVTPPTETLTPLTTTNATPTLTGTASDANGIASVSVVVGGQTLAAANWAKMTYADRLISLTDLSTLAKLSVTSTRGGSDTKHTLATDYALTVTGPWTSV